MKKMHNSPEDWASSVFGDLFTNGWMDAINGIWRLIVKLTASTSLVFLRHQTGTRFISGATLFWGYMLVAIFWILDVLLGSGKSVSLFIQFNLLFAVVTLYRVIESRYNLRRQDGKGRKRYGGDTGLSHLWPFFKGVLSATPIIPQDGGARHWWQLDEYKFQRFVEPLFIWFVGSIMWKLGFGSFGFFLQFSALCAFMLMQQFSDAYYETKQQKWDAEIIGQVIQHSDEPVERKSGMVAQQSLVRSDKGFERWKAQQESQVRAHGFAEHSNGQPVEAA